MAPADTESRFWRHVVQAGDSCWEWKAGRNRQGYGLVSAPPRRSRLAHRLSREMFCGPIPAGLLVLHHCDNPPCVNPAHLYVGTVADNTRDRVERRRSRGARRTLTHERVVDVLTASHAGESSARIAARFGMDPSHVRRIVRREIYGDIAVPLDPSTRKEPTVKANPPIPGHELLYEGEPRRRHDSESGAWLPRGEPDSYAGGCRCGAKPEGWPALSANAVKRWHRTHKADLRALVCPIDGPAYEVAS